MKTKQIANFLGWLLHKVTRVTSGFFFTLKLKYLKWKHKGTKNIPSDEIGQMLPLGREFFAIFQVVEAMQKIGELVGFNHCQTNMGMEFGQVLRGELLPVEVRERWDKLILSTDINKGTLDVLIELGDVNPRTLDFVLKAKEKEHEFRNWLLEPFIYKEAQ